MLTAHLVIALVAVASAPPPAVVIQDPSPPKVDENTARVIGELTTFAASRHKVFDVLSASDLRRVVELEAEKQVAGCSDETSCLAEVAGAMGARYVVFGQIATLGSQIILTLNLFDSQAGASSGRVVVRAVSVDDLSEKIEPAMDDLLGAAKAEAEQSSEKVRILVMDLEPPKATQAAPSTTVINVEATTEEALPTGVFFLAGGGAAVLVGAGLAGGGLVFGFLADSAHQRIDDAPYQDVAAAAVAERDTSALVANILFGSGAAVAVVGVATAAAAPFFWE